MALVQVLIPPNACRAEEFDAQLGGSSRGTAAALNPDMASLSSPLIALENHRRIEISSDLYRQQLPFWPSQAVLAPTR